MSESRGPSAGGDLVDLNYRNSEVTTSNPCPECAVTGSCINITDFSNALPFGSHAPLPYEKPSFASIASSGFNAAPIVTSLLRIEIPRRDLRHVPSIPSLRAKPVSNYSDPYGRRRQ